VADRVEISSAGGTVLLWYSRPDCCSIPRCYTLTMTTLKRD